MNRHVTENYNFSSNSWTCDLLTVIHGKKNNFQSSYPQPTTYLDLEIKRWNLKYHLVKITIYLCKIGI